MHQFDAFNVWNFNDLLIQVIQFHDFIGEIVKALFVVK